MVLQQELPVLLGEGMRLLRVLRSSLVLVTALIPRRLVVSNSLRVRHFAYFHPALFPSCRIMDTPHRGEYIWRVWKKKTTGTGQVGLFNHPIVIILSAVTPDVPHIQRPGCLRSGVPFSEISDDRGRSPPHAKALGCCGSQNQDQERSRSKHLPRKLVRYLPWWIPVEARDNLESTRARRWDRYGTVGQSGDRTISHGGMRLDEQPFPWSLRNHSPGAKPVGILAWTDNAQIRVSLSRRLRLSASENLNRLLQFVSLTKKISIDQPIKLRGRKIFPGKHI